MISMAVKEGLGYAAINAVHKEEISLGLASRFVLGDATVKANLVDIGLPSDLDAFVIDNVLSVTECAQLVSLAEEAGLTFWDTSRETPRKDYRNADTVEVFQKKLAEQLWQRIETCLPEFARTIHIQDGDVRSQPDLDGTWDATGTNNKILFAKYTHGGHFSPHTDGYSIVDFNHRSMYTLLIYLNECESGGGTRFYSDAQLAALAPDEEGRFTGQNEHVIATVDTKPGRALLFFHNIVHEGVPVAEGSEKYIIRSDLMHTRNPKICDSEEDRIAFDLYQQADELSAQGKIMEATKLYKRLVKLSPALAQVYSL
eukprot:m.3971 g.3971  ORF g.3971 m.3971 type:complete len:314 (-) comp2860_c0_seq1:147-1088(-)